MTEVISAEIFSHTLFDRTQKDEKFCSPPGIHGLLDRVLAISINISTPDKFTYFRCVMETWQLLKHKKIN